MRVVQGVAGDLMRLPERPLCEHHYLLGQVQVGIISYRYTANKIGYSRRGLVHIGAFGQMRLRDI